MAGKPGAWLLDLSRTASRLERGPATGIDRVEAAYLSWLIDRPEPLFGLVRTGIGYLLLDRRGCMALAARLREGRPLPPAGRLAHWLARGDARRARAEAEVRRLAVARAPGWLLPRLLGRHLPHGTRYLNVGHANLASPVFAAVHRAGGRAAVMLHDVIPLDHPEFARPGVPQAFEARLRAVAAGADLVLHLTGAGQARTEAQLARFGRVPPGRVAPLGMTAPRPDASTLPPGLPPERPYFLALGTIEPRKNHALLLDLWDGFGSGPDVPGLVIAGGRGWANKDVFRRLDALRGRGGPVIEVAGLADGAVAALLQGAQALVFPSQAEGFGLPPVEAALLGVPVICSDLPELREVMGDYPVYLNLSDSYSWRDTILRHGRTGGSDGRQATAFRPSTWEDHFKVLLSPDW